MSSFLYSIATALTSNTIPNQKGHQPPHYSAVSSALVHHICPPHKHYNYVILKSLSYGWAPM